MINLSIADREKLVNAINYTFEEIAVLGQSSIVITNPTTGKQERFYPDVITSYSSLVGIQNELYNAVPDADGFVKITTISFLPEAPLVPVFVTHKVELNGQVAERKRTYKVVCAANKYANGHIICGVRHCDKFMADSMTHGDLHDIGIGVNAVQGFVNSYGDFLTREEAYIAALHNNQCAPKPSKTLYSEDLY